MLQHYFDDFGHKCSLNLNNPFTEIIANKNWFQLWVMKNKVINSKLILLRSRPRSCNAMRKELLCHLQNYPCVLHPFSTITFFCEIVWMIAVLILLFILPLNVFKHMYLENYRSQEPKYFEMALNTICIFDCIRRFFTGYLIQHHDCDEIVLDVTRISCHYIKFYFFIDLLSTLPSFIELYFLKFPNYILTLEIISFLKFFRLSSTMNVIRNVMHFYRINFNFISIFNSLLKLAFTVHWVACFSVLVGIIEQRFDSTIVQWFNSVDKRMSICNIYVTCLHRTTSILTGIGFNFFQHNTKKGNVISVSGLVYTIFTAILGHILTVIIFGKTCQKITGMRSSQGKYENMLNEVSEYMKHQYLPETTQNTIKTFYAYKYEHAFFNEHEILATIPNVLRENISMHCAKLLLQNIDFFNKLPSSVLVNLVSHLGKEIVMSGDVIFHCNDKGDTVYFIISGTVASFTCNGREIIHEEDGGYFGQSSLMFETLHDTRIFTKVAIETCELFTLAPSEFYSFQNYCPDLVQQMGRVGFEHKEMAILAKERYDHLLNKELLRREKNEARLSNLF